MYYNRKRYTETEGVFLSKKKPSEYAKKIPSAAIEANLQEYKKTVEAVCSNCGYEGLMGVGKKTLKWYVRWPLAALIVLVAALIWQFFLQGSLLALIVISFIMSSILPRLFKNFIHCPQCGQRLKLKKI